MKKLLRSKVEKLYIKNFIFLAKVATFLLLRSSQEKLNNCMIITPTEPGSFGDLAMMSVAIKEIKSYGLKPVLFAQSELWKKELASIDDDIILSYSKHSLSAPFGWLKFISDIKRYTPSAIICIGADVLDGYYSEHRSLSRLSYLDIAKKVTDRQVITGFSYNESPVESCKKYLQHLSEKGVTLYARDEDSHSRMLKDGINSTKTMDIAFLLSSKRPSFPLPEKYSCLNICNVHQERFGQDLVDNIYEFFNEIVANSETNFVLVPHDTRRNSLGETDYTLLEKFYKQLPQKERDKCTLISQKISPQEVRFITSNADYCIVGRKHMGVAALGELTPTLFFEYQGKQNGLVKLCGLNPENNVLNPNKNIEKWIVQYHLFLGNLATQRQVLSDNMPKIKAMAEKNFEVLSSM